MPFKPGQSGNPAGRPRKGKALAEILEVASREAVDVDGRPMSARVATMRMIWQGITTGSILLPAPPAPPATDPRGSKRPPRRRKFTLKFADWQTLVEFVFNRIDGNKLGLELSGPHGGPMEVRDIEAVRTRRWDQVMPALAQALGVSAATAATPSPEASADMPAGETPGAGGDTSE